MHRIALKHVASGAALGLGLIVSPAHAADSDFSTTFSGYGTVAATVTDSATAGYRTSLQQFNGVYNRLDVGLESRVGLQGVVKYGSDFSFVTQVLAQQVGAKSFGGGVEWMFGQYTPISGLDLRLGRVVMPTFLLSDSRNVGYATTWLRAPNEVYGAMPFTTLDGVQGLWRLNAGPAIVTTQLSYGNTSATLKSGTDIIEIKAKDVVAVGVTVESGDWTVRVAQSHLSVPTALPLGPNFTVNYKLQDTFLSTGLQYDNGTAVVMSEWTRRTQNDVPVVNKPISGTTAWYVAAGWRFGSLTPMVRYASNQSETNVLRTFPDTSSVGLMLRYDVTRNVALKVQVDRYDASSTTAFISPERTSGNKINVASFGADFVF